MSSSQPRISLRKLADEATAFVSFSMKRVGGLPPTMLASTDDGIIMYMAGTMEGISGKDDFVATARMITASYGATAVVVAVASWLRMMEPRKDGKIDMTPPSECIDRREVVTVMGQSYEGRVTRMMSIVRLDNGKFWNLGEVEEMEAHDIQGRFSQLLPEAFIPDCDLREKGKDLLRMMGVDVHHMGFKPKWGKI